MINQDDVYIEEVNEFSPDILEAVKHLIRQLDDNFQELTEDDFRSIITSSHIHLYLARLRNGNRIVGMITLVVYRIPYKRKAQLEDLVVDMSLRGKGIGKKLIEYALNKARTLGVKSINFTSNPKRESANRLYQRLGFEKRDTNTYSISL